MDNFGVVMSTQIYNLEKVSSKNLKECVHKKNGYNLDSVQKLHDHTNFELELVF